MIKNGEATQDPDPITEWTVNRTSLVTLVWFLVTITPRLGQCRLHTLPLLSASPMALLILQPISVGLTQYFQPNNIILRINSEQPPTTRLIGDRG